MASRIFLLGLNTQEKPITVEDAAQYLERLLDDFDEAAQDEGLYIRTPGNSPFLQSSKCFSEVLQSEEPEQFNPDILSSLEDIEKLVRYDYGIAGNILYTVPTEHVLDIGKAVINQTGMSNADLPKTIADRELLFIDTYAKGKVSKY